MAIKFAKDMIREIQERREIFVPQGYVTGEAYEEWLYEEVTWIDGNKNDMFQSEKNTFISKQIDDMNVFSENYGDAA